MVAAIEAGFPQREIERRAYEHQRAVEEKRRVIVGENAFTDDDGSRAAGPAPAGPVAWPPARLRRLRAFRARGRDQTARAARQSLDAVAAAARGRDNVVAATLAAVKVGATLGEVADRLRSVFGEHRREPDAHASSAEAC